MWNTITIQYNPLIEEEWDEHFKVKYLKKFIIIPQTIQLFVFRLHVNMATISGKQSLFLF